MPLPKCLLGFGLLTTLLAGAPAVVGGGIPLDEYRARRSALQRDLDGVFVLFGRTAAELDEMREGFYQEPYFYYLTGWTEPNAALLLTKSSQILFVPPRNERFEKYYGHMTAPGDADVAAKTGFTQVLPRPELEAQLLAAAGTKGSIYTVPSAVYMPRLEGLASLRPEVHVLDGAKRIDKLRMVKSSAEQWLLQRAVDVSIAAQRAAIRSAGPGSYEYEVAATLYDEWQRHGCQRPAYPPIVGSGPNATTLHYWENRRRMDSGDMLVMDAGAECSYYASDITRSFPVSGRFTARQREIYEIVLAAQQAAIDAVKPGMYLGPKERKGSLGNIAYEYINTHGTDRRGDPLGKYTIHGVSHHVGLDVHDPGPPDEPLAAGMVITVEPGVYLPEENLGVRIEDMVLVTETGHRVLTEALPREAGQVEQLMNR